MNPGTHIPPMNGPSQMTKALQALGMSDDFEVKKRTIYASKGNVVIEAELLNQK